MPTNVPPQYREAEDRFRKSKTPQEKIVVLHEMLTLMPKHKGTDHLKAQLRSRMSKLMAELQDSVRKGRSSRIEPFSIPKQGAGRATLIGHTNVGKSSLLSRSTGAHSIIGSYALSTQEPLPGMLRYENILVQLIDTPPIEKTATQSRLYGLLRTTDVFVLVLDLSHDPMFQLLGILAELNKWGLSNNNHLTSKETSYLVNPKTTIIVGNKADVQGGLDHFQILQTALGKQYQLIMTSAEENFGLGDLGDAIFTSLNIVRIYTKSPRETLENLSLSTPYVLPQGSLVSDVARLVHKDLLKKLKFAILWGSSGKFESQHVGRNHMLADGDIVELHG